MPRKLTNWLTSYLEYTANTESSPIFNRWVGVSTIASALRKKTWLQVGRLRVYPNLYIVLVADPGVARKSQAISYASELLQEVPQIMLSADSGSAIGLMESLLEAVTYDVVGAGTDSAFVVNHASLSVVSREFESFLSNIGGSKMIVTLTDLYDAGEKPWKHRTQKAGTLAIPSVFLNILGATTPESLSSTLSSLVFGGGLASRITFVCSTEKAQKVPFPEMTPELKQLKEDLIHDLQLVSGMLGEFTFSTEAKTAWTKWYMLYDEQDPKRIQPKSEFNGWYSRKPMLIQKLSTILSATEGDSMEVTEDHLTEAMKLVEEVEKGMGLIVNEVVKQATTNKVSLIEGTVKEHNQLSEKHLLQLIWRDIDEETFDTLMNPLLKGGTLKRVYESPQGKEEIWYHWKGEPAK